MLSARGFAAHTASEQLKPFEFSRREPGSNDVVIEIQYCGVCHSDIHQARDEWGGSTFPMVPGHEIVGTVKSIGKGVSKIEVGQLAGIGCFVDSCRSCSSCKAGLEQYCEGHLSFTYNGTEKDQRTPTYGGYSNVIVVDENYVLNVPTSLELARVAPLLCAGITTYSPLRHWKVGAGHRLGIVGLGGLGHMGVKFGASLGAEVTVLSTSPSKEADARSLGAHRFALSKNEETMRSLAGSFDFILDTVAAPHDLNALLNLLKRDGTLMLVGVAPEAAAVAAASLIMKRRRLVGSLIGGIAETQEMLDYCGQHSIMSDIELIPMSQINTAYDRVVKGDVKYRFVIDMKTL